MKQSLLSVLSLIARVSTPQLDPLQWTAVKCPPPTNPLCPPPVWTQAGLGLCPPPTRAPIVVMSNEARLIQPLFPP
eukprot:scaffold92449_cov81-Cyclotella_meneghiniana.AAC.2